APQPDGAAAPAPRKGRPTPTRKEAEAARRRPLVTNRKQDVQRSRARDKERREREYQAMLTGSERDMPPRDKGPVRRWVRDYIDARRNPGEYFLPVSIVVVMATFFTANRPELALIIIGILYLVVFIT